VNRSKRFLCFGTAFRPEAAFGDDPSNSIRVPVHTELVTWILLVLAAQFLSQAMSSAQHYYVYIRQDQLFSFEDSFARVTITIDYCWFSMLRAYFPSQGKLRRP